MQITLTRFQSFLSHIVSEYGEGCCFAFLAIDTDEMRFPTFGKPDVIVSCEEGADGVDLVIAETPGGAPLSITAMQEAIEGAIEEFDDEILNFVFVDEAGDIVFETDSLEDYEYSVIEPDGHRSSHSF